MKVSEINIREKEYYLSTIEEQCSQIENYPGESDSIECLFNILRDMGYLLMYGSEPDDRLLNRVKKLFPVINENTAIFSPSFIDFISLEIETEGYKELWHNHDVFIQSPPTLKENPLIEEAWEKVFNYMKQRGLDLINAGLDLFAVLYSNQMFFKDIQSSDGWQKSWKIFLEKSDVFFNTLFNIEEKYFFHVSDSVYKIICKYAEIKEIIPQPAANFINFIHSISKPRKSYAADSAYRIVVSPEEAEEIYFNISCNYNDNSQGLSKIYLYECALAEKVIKQFIIKKCLSENASDKIRLPPISDWKLLSSSDDEFYSALPMVKAGNKEYSVCVIPPRLKGFSIRNDLIKKSGSSLNGVLFCSFKKYPSDEILMRFDNYIEKDRVFELLGNTDAVNGVQNVTKLSFDEVYKFDKREEFLREAAEAVVKSEKVVVIKQSESEQIPNTDVGSAMDLSGIIPAELRALEQILITANAAVFLIRIILTAIKNTKQQYAFRVYKPSPSKMSYDAAKPPEYNIIFVPSDFPDEGGMFDFLDPNSDQEDVRQLRFYGLEQDWQFVPFFIDAKGEIIGEPDNPEEIDELDPIELNLPAKTKVVLIAVGPSEELIKVKNAKTSEDPIDDTKSKICWVIYGTEKETSANQE